MELKSSLPKKDISKKIPTKDVPKYSDKYAAEMIKGDTVTLESYYDKETLQEMEGAATLECGVSDSDFSKPEDFAPKAGKYASKKKPAEIPPRDFVGGNKVQALIDGDQIFKEIRKMMRSANSSIQLQMYEFGQDKLADLMIAEAKKGIKVQVILDPPDEANETDKKEIIEKLKAGGVQVLTYPIKESKKQIDHVKLLVIDGKSAIIGGMNWGAHSMYNHDVNVRIDGPVVKHMTDTFKDDWLFCGGKKEETTDEYLYGGTPDLSPAGDTEVKFGTTDLRGHQEIEKMVLDNIGRAKKSIHAELFCLAKDEIIEGLIKAHNDGLDVKVILDPLVINGFNVNSRTARKLKAAGVPVKWFSGDLTTEQKLHAKMGLFDGEESVLGSANWTDKGLEINHETDVDVKSKEVTSAFEQMFENDWENLASEKPIVRPSDDIAPPTWKKSLQEQFAYDLKKYFAIRGEITPVKRELDKNIIDKFNGEFEDPTAFIQAFSYALSKDKNFHIEKAPEKTSQVAELRQKITDGVKDKLIQAVPELMQGCVDTIKDKDFKDFAALAIQKAPPEFFQSPSSSTGKYHPADENCTGGLVLHTRRVVELGDSLCKMFGASKEEREQIITALTLHDIIKNGIPWGEFSTKDHGVVAANWLKQFVPPKKAEKFQNVLKYVNNHMGRWNDPTPTPPTDKCDLIVCMADKLVSLDNVYYDVGLDNMVKE